MFYNFRSHHLPDLDAMLYEIVKVQESPLLLPFVVIVFRHSVVGHRPLFTDLFHSKDWGTSISDLRFLEQLWCQLHPDTEGPLDLNTLFEERRKNGTGQVDPLVYRRPLEEVVTRVLTRSGLEKTQEEEKEDYLLLVT